MSSPDVARHPSSPRKTPRPPARMDPADLAQYRFCNDCHSLRAMVLIDTGIVRAESCFACGGTNVIPADLPRAKQALGDRWEAAYRDARNEARRIICAPEPPKPPEPWTNKLAMGLLVLLLLGIAGLVITGIAFLVINP